MIELGPRARLVFAAAYFAAQVALIATAPLRADRAFGFQMFSESSTMAIHLTRRVESMSGHGLAAVDVAGGEWTAKGEDGRLHRFAWRDRVHDPLLGNLDTTMAAAYGAAAQLARIQAALDDVATHIPDDAETRQLVADVVIRKNGREPTATQLSSALR